MFRDTAANSSRTRGFSLIEFALVMIISGFVIAGAISLYAVHAKRAKLENTFEKVYSANALMMDAFNLEGRYYCPADPTLAPGDANYGLENCPDAAVGPGSCTGGANSGVCVGAGMATELANDDVLLGMFPFRTVAEAYDAQFAAVQTAYEAALDPGTKASLKRTLEMHKKSRLSEAVSLAFDGWGNQLTYAVSRALTVPDPTTDLQKLTGAIEVVNAQNEIDSWRGVHFALISHGENGKAAYNRKGKRSMGCDDAQLSDIEAENCDNDGTILRPALLSKAENDQEADDIVAYNAYTSKDLWERIACDTDNNPNTPNVCIRSKNPGNIGIGFAGAEITQKLTVAGQMRAQKVSAAEICDEDGGNCFAASYIGGTAMNQCDQTGLPPNRKRVAVRIENKEMICEEVEVPGYGVSCPTNHLVAGYNSSGPICIDPCRTATRNETLECPPGMVGSITTQNDFQCPERAWTGWNVVADTCAFPPPPPPPPPPL